MKGCLMIIAVILLFMILMTLMEGCSTEPSKTEKSIEQEPVELKLIATDEKTGCRLYEIITREGISRERTWVYWSVCSSAHSGQISSSVATH